MSGRFLIAKGSHKREITLPFGICASREAMIVLRDSINRWLEDPGNGLGISYGWLRVDDLTEWVFGPPGTAPEPWEDPPSKPRPSSTG